ncbi:MAG: hypothetical protein ICV62_01865 [Cyanobacteria bacterium Co-bin13]|nr:hypothetical protein [Cyanobacteria bacterium Co-bin13]
MFCPGLSDIKWERLILAVTVTVLLADSLPHSRLGTGLSSQGMEHLQQAWTQVREGSAAVSTAVRP